MFKVGDKVRRTYGHCKGQTVGYEGVISGIGDDRLYFPDGTWGLADRFELVQPVGPVVTETVTKTRIVPGVYDRVHVTDSTVTVFVDYGAFGKLIAADQLDAAAAVLSALAKGLRDA